MAKSFSMKKIIAPVDFSATAENSAIFAARLAAFYGAELWLYHSYEIMIPVSGFDFPFVTAVEMQDAAEHELIELQKKIESVMGYSIKIHTRATESALAGGLSALCDELVPDMVVMGLSGKNALTRLIVGSNTIKTIQQLNYPVLVVPPKASFIPVRKIGFACDYEKVIATTPVEPLKKLVRDFNADLFVLNIVYDPSAVTDQTIRETLYITELLKEFKPSYHTILSADITEGINWFAETQHIDWMVVIPKKHNLTEKLFSRSKTRDLLYHTHMPVLCMHE